MRFGINEKSNNKFLKFKSFEQAKKDARLYIEDFILSQKELSEPIVKCDKTKKEWHYKCTYYPIEFGAFTSLDIYVFFHEEKVAIDVVADITLKKNEVDNLNKEKIKSLAFDYDLKAYVGKRVKIRPESEMVLLNEGMIDCICDEGRMLYDRDEQSELEIGIDFLLEQMNGVLYCLKAKSKSFLKNKDLKGDHDKNTAEHKNGSNNEKDKEKQEAQKEIKKSKYDDAEDVFDEDNEVQMTLQELEELIQEGKERIVGQDEYVESVAFCIYEGLNSNPGNMLVVGPTGSGKTHTVKTLIQILKDKGRNIGFLKEDVSNYTANGFKGGDIEQIKKKIFVQTFTGKELVVVFLDEIDKLLVPEYDGYGKNVNKEIQSELLSLLAKDISDADTSEDEVKKRVMFICTGAFVELEEIKEKHRKASVGMGFKKGERTKDTIITETVKLEELLMEYGAIPEFIGRINYFLEINALTKKDYWNIAMDDEFGVVKQMEKEYKKYGYDLKFRKNVIEEIVNNADKQPLGARYIKSTFRMAARNSFLNNIKCENSNKSKDKLMVCKKDLSL